MLTLPPISKPNNGRRFAIGDIHGCAKTFRYLVEDVLRLSLNDQLFPLGDYIDRGPNSGEVIDYILDLQQKGFQVYPLKGNHEQEFEDCYQSYCMEEGKPSKMKRIYKLFKSLDLLQESGEPIPRYLDFVQGLPHYIELEHCFLVHAAFRKGTDMFNDTQAMLWLRHSHVDLDWADLGGKHLIHGHTPISIHQIREDVANRRFNISLDNGCVFKDRFKFRKDPSIILGNLCALDLDTWELFETPCIDELPPKGKTISVKPRLH